MASRVFIPQLARSFDMAQITEATELASAFGEVIVIMNRQDDVRKPDECMAKIKRVLADFNDEDYLLPMGSQHYMLWTAIVAASKVDVLKTLQWDIRTGRYNVYRVTIGDTNEQAPAQTHYVGSTEVRTYRGRKG